MSDKEKIVEYLNWSDKGYEEFEAGHGRSGFGELNFWIDHDTKELVLNIRRNSKIMKDFTILISHHTKEIYELLKEEFTE